MRRSGARVRLRGCACLCNVSSLSSQADSFTWYIQGRAACPSALNQCIDIPYKECYKSHSVVHDIHIRMRHFVQQHFLSLEGIFGAIKTGKEKRFYKEYVAKVDAIYKQHLGDLKE
jgi:hypothetical protein